MSKILILGGTGIISTSVVSEIIDKHDITIVNRGIHKNNFGCAVKTIKCNLRNESLEELKSKFLEEYDVVIDFVSYTTQELKRNLELFNHKFKQYIFISTSTIFNESSSITEESDLSDLSWVYCKNKHDCEKLLIEESKKGGFAYSIVRPYVTYDKTRIPLQFAPNEYYTVINRMLTGKPIIVVNKDKEISITNSYDFAKLFKNIIMNEKAFNNDFNIVGKDKTTWFELYQLCEKGFGAPKVDYIFIDNLQDMKDDVKGLNLNELIYDKSRTMLFDNKKIASLSNEKLTSKSIRDSLSDIVDHFKNNKRINYAWDARYDYFLIKHKLVNKKQKKNLKFASSVPCTFKDKIAYLINRNGFLFKLKSLFKK